MADERTRLPRFKIKNLNVVYDTGDGFWSGTVSDSSATGLFIETTHDLPVGTSITLMPDGPDDDRIPFEVSGRVVRLNEVDLDNHWDRTPGIAIKFEGMTQQEVDQLQSFLIEHGSRMGPS